MDPLKKINNLNIVNISLAFFPVSLILGNSIINLNFTIFTLAGLFYLYKNNIKFKINNFTKIIGLLFIFIILSSVINLIKNYGNIVHPDISINDYWNSLKKTLIYLLS